MAAVKRDYYEVLGVDREADVGSIKRAFYALARDWHPDVAEAPEAEERFRELAEAYSVLSKREARLLYDRYGYRGRGNQVFDEDLFEDSFLREVPLEEPFEPEELEAEVPAEETEAPARERVAVPRRPAVTRRGENMHVDLAIRAFEATEGTRRVVTYDAQVRCKACMGRGSMGLPDPDCEVCGGSGRKRTVASVAAANLIQIEPCSECVGEACKQCDGAGTVKGHRRIRLLVPPGVEDGAQLRVTGDGHDAGAGSIPGDLLVRLSVSPPPRDPRAVRYAAFALLVIAVATLVLYLLTS